MSKRLLTLLIGMALSGGQTAHAQTPAAQRPAATVAASAAPATPGGDTIRVLLAPDRETTLASPIPGRIRSLNTSLGSGFGAGQVLIALECDEPNARLRIAKAELASAVEQLDAKQRMQALQQAGDVEINMAQSAAEKARAQVALQQAQVAQCSIVAPWGGRTAKVHVRSHMSVTAGQPLVELVKSGPLKLRLNAPSRWLGHLKTGLAFEVAIEETGKRYPTKVSAVNSRVDSVSQTVELEATLSGNFPELLPGMSGTAVFPAR